MEEVPNVSVQDNAGASGGGAMSMPYAVSARINASGGTTSPGTSVESSQVGSEEDDADDSPSPELEGRAARELRWLRENPIILQVRTRGEKKRLYLDSATLFVEEALATEEIKGWLSVSVIHDCLTGTDGLHNPLLLGAVNDVEMNFALGVVESSA